MDEGALWNLSVGFAIVLFASQQFLIFLSSYEYMRRLIERLRTDADEPVDDEDEP